MALLVHLLMYLNVPAADFVRNMDAVPDSDTWHIYSTDMIEEEIFHETTFRHGLSKSHRRPEHSQD